MSRDAGVSSYRCHPCPAIRATLQFASIRDSGIHPAGCGEYNLQPVVHGGYGQQNGQVPVGRSAGLDFFALSLAMDCLMRLPQFPRQETSTPSQGMGREPGCSNSGHRTSQSSGGSCGVRRGMVMVALVCLAMILSALDSVAVAQGAEGVVPQQTRSFLNVREMLAAGGTIGYIIMGFSFIMVALIIDHLMNIRRSILIPPGLAEEIHRCLAERKIEEAKKYCEQHPGFLSRVLFSGLDEVGLGYTSIEKAMEDAAVEQSARLFRRIEHLSVISALAPMLGLMGTVWGMILAFLEFEQKANPQVSELAPGIYRALITTLQGLGVAIPSLAAFSFFRNRIDELVAEGTLMAQHVFADYRRLLLSRRSPRSTPGSDGG